jgi:2-hydroxychromene-2-carboxylate isomerase
MPQKTVDMWFDTLCPWAWMTSRWLVEVEKVRDVSVNWNVMSLYYLNKDRSHISAEYLDYAKKALGPLRIIVGAEKIHGPAIKGELYTAFGEEIHLRKAKFSPELNMKVLSQLSYGQGLAELAEDESLDELILASHNLGLAKVGEDVGTPIVSMGDVAFFGPVISPAPKGEEAGKLFDGVFAVASYPGFFELKRTRTAKPIFD